MEPQNKNQYKNNKLKQNRIGYAQKKVVRHRSLELLTGSLMTGLLKRAFFDKRRETV